MFLKAFSHTIAWIWRWKVETPLKSEKCVVLANPHTSNWDGFWLMVLSKVINVEMSWMVKKSAVKGLLGKLMLSMGAIPIDRAAKGDLVSKMVDEFNSRDKLILFIPPAGTRAQQDHWKSGFYHIARGADVPVVLGYLDYSRKRAGFGDEIRLTGDVNADMDMIRAKYAEINPVAKYPQNLSTIRLRDESPEEPAQEEAERTPASPTSS
jgi:1-acyl-sn-glycerol-3-phosphate acyltransferase